MNLLLTDGFGYAEELLSTLSFKPKFPIDNNFVKVFFLGFVQRLDDFSHHQPGIDIFVFGFLNHFWRQVHACHTVCNVFKLRSRQASAASQINDVLETYLFCQNPVQSLPKQFWGFILKPFDEMAIKSIVAVKQGFYIFRRGLGWCLSLESRQQVFC